MADKDNQEISVPAPAPDEKMLDFVRVEEREGKGKVLCTTKAFKAGEVIFKDPPILVYEPPADGERIPGVDAVCKEHRVESNFFYAVLAAVKAPQEKRDLINALFCPSAQDYTMTAGSQMRYHVLCKVTDALFEASQGQSWLQGASKAQFKRYLFIWDCNAMELARVLRGRQVSSSAVFSTYSRMSHSCAPNAWSAPNAGATQVVKALRDIPEGEEVQISYLSDQDLFRPTLARQEKLALTKCFRCKCERCLGPDTTRQFRYVGPNGACKALLYAIPQVKKAKSKKKKKKKKPTIGELFRIECEDADGKPGHKFSEQEVAEALGMEQAFLAKNADYHRRMRQPKGLDPNAFCMRLEQHIAEMRKVLDDQHWAINLATTLQRDLLQHVMKKPSDALARTRRILAFHNNALEGVNPTKAMLAETTAELIMKDPELVVNPAEMVYEALQLFKVAADYFTVLLGPESQPAKRNVVRVGKMAEVLESCARPGCENAGDKSCAGCEKVKYCGRDCQVKDFKNRHKKFCKKC